MGVQEQPLGRVRTACQGGRARERRSVSRHAADLGGGVQSPGDDRVAARSRGGYQSEGHVWRAFPRSGHHGASLGGPIWTHAGGKAPDRTRRGSTTSTKRRPRGAQASSGRRKFGIIWRRPNSLSLNSRAGTGHLTRRTTRRRPHAQWPFAAPCRAVRRKAA